MRAFVILIVAALAGCDQPPRSFDFEGLLVKVEALEHSCERAENAAGEIGTLRRTVAELRADLEMTRAMIPAPQKVPHLIGPDGEDLGVFVGGSAAIREDVDGQVDYSQDFTIFYSGDNCTGGAFTNTGYFARRTSLIIGPDWRLWRTPVRADTATRPKSAKHRDRDTVRCDAWASPDPIPVYAIEDAGVAVRKYAAAELSVELR